jgi:hypothetical protein
MTKYNISDIGTTGLVGITDTIVQAVPPFFPILIFVIWLLGSLVIYYSNIKTTNEKNLKNGLLAMSFVCFLLSLFISSLNTQEIIYLPFYWIIFYIVTTAFIYLFIKDN